MLRFITEIKRRRVIPVAAYYVLGVWLVLQAADILLPAWGVPQRIIQLIVYAALLGFPFVLIFGWLYDLGPGGIVRTPSVKSSDKGSLLGPKDFILLALMSVAILAIGGWVVDQMLTDDPAVPYGPRNSVAVLAFEDTTDSEDFVAIDLSDRIIDSLISVKGLRVTGRESSFYFTNRSYPLDEIARMLNVQHLITGQASRDNGRTTISIQLIRMPEEVALWAQTFSTAEQDAPAMFAKIAGHVAKALQVKLTSEELRGIESEPKGDRLALDFVGLSEEALFAGDFQRSMFLADQAIERDLGLASAHVQKALSYLFSFSHTGTPAVEEVMRVVSEALDRAEALGANDSDYYLARGLQARRAIWMDGGTPAWHKQLEDSFRHAIALNPSDAQPYVSLSIYFRRARRYNESTDLLEKALNYDPLNPGAILQYSRNLSALERYEEALQSALRLPQLFGFGEREIAFRYLECQQLDKAIEWFLNAPSDDPRNARDIAALLGSLDASEDAVTWLEKIADHEVFGPTAQSMIAAIRGNHAAAFDQIKQFINAETSNPEWFQQAVDTALRSGRPDEAIVLIEQMDPALKDPLSPEVTEQNAEMAVLLNVALRQSGGDSVRTGILSGMLLNLNRNRPAIGWDGIGLRTVRVYALQGEAEKAVNALQSAYTQGFRQVYSYDGLLQMPLETLNGDRRFDQLMRSINRDLAEMRERAVALLDGR